MKLSIIIPMYNAEKYIADCLDSILKSDLPKGEYEVIIVNDGSKDKGPEIAQDYVSKHENFRYLTQENQGQSVARNYGIKEAQGEYLWFVDSDDKISSGIIDVIKVLDENNLDSLVTNMIVVDENDKQIAPNTSYNIQYDTIIKGRDVFFSNVPIGSVCGNFIKKELLLKNNLFFKPGITQQDVELSNRLFAYAKKVMFVKNYTYVYIKHSNSVTMSIDLSKRKKYILNTIDIISSLQILSEELYDVDRELSKHIKEKSNNVLFGFMFNLLKNKKKWKKNGITEEVLMELKKRNLYPIRCKYSSCGKNLLTKIFNIEALLR